MSEQDQTPGPPGAGRAAGAADQVPPRRLRLTGLPPEGPRWRRALRWLLYGALVAANLLLAGLVAAWLHFASGLPDLPSVEGYRPPIVTEVISADGQIAGEFFSERRKVVPYQRIPRRLIQAFLASEDQRFFDHGGVDWRGTARAAVTTYLLRQGVKGGSTITQQTAKAILVSSEGLEAGTRKNLHDGQVNIRGVVWRRWIRQAIAPRDRCLIPKNPRRRYGRHVGNNGNCR